MILFENYFSIFPTIRKGNGVGDIHVATCHKVWGRHKVVTPLNATEDLKTRISEINTLVIGRWQEPFNPIPCYVICQTDRWIHTLFFGSLETWSNFDVYDFYFCDIQFLFGVV